MKNSHVCFFRCLLSSGIILAVGYQFIFRLVLLPQCPLAVYHVSWVWFAMVRSEGLAVRYLTRLLSDDIPQYFIFPEVTWVHPEPHQGRRPSAGRGLPCRWGRPRPPRSARCTATACGVSGTASSPSPCRPTWSTSASRGSSPTSPCPGRRTSSPTWSSTSTSGWWGPGSSSCPSSSSASCSRSEICPMTATSLATTSPPAPWTRRLSWQDLQVENFTNIYFLNLLIAGLVRNAWHHGGPTSSFIHLVSSFCFLLPRIIIEAKLIEVGFLSRGWSPLPLHSCISNCWLPWS